MMMLSQNYENVILNEVKNLIFIFFIFFIFFRFFATLRMTSLFHVPTDILALVRTFETASRFLGRLSPCEPIDISPD